MKSDRRTFIKKTLMITGAAVTAAALPDVMAMMPELKETDPEAKAIGYHSSAREVDSNKYPNFEEGQRCSNCALAGFSSAIRKPCQLVPGKLVNGGGWCMKWVKR